MHNYDKKIKECNEMIELFDILINNYIELIINNIISNNMNTK